MGKIVTVEYVDDLDNKPIDPASVDTVEFSYRGKEYSLVLTTQNGAQFDKDIARYIRAARKSQERDAKAARLVTRTSPRRAAKRTRTAKPNAAPRKTAAPSKKSQPSVSGPERNSAIRKWANDNGHKVSPRGRLSPTVVAAYDAAH